MEVDYLKSGIVVVANHIHRNQDIKIYRYTEDIKKKNMIKRREKDEYSQYYRKWKCW